MREYGEKKPKRRNPMQCFSCSRCGFSSYVKRFFHQEANQYGDRVTVCCSRSCQ